MTRVDDKGFTLIETLLTVVIMSIISGVLVEATIVGLRNVDKANVKLANGNDVQLVASYFTGDTSSADTISTRGATRLAAPGVNVTSANSKLVSFWAIKKQTSLTPPGEMDEGWDLASSGANALGRITAVMADDDVADTGPTGNRIGDAAIGTSSIGHSVALARSGSGTITRRAVATGTVGTTATSLTIARPTCPALTNCTGDVLLAQIAVEGGPRTAVTKPDNTWSDPVTSRDAGTLIRSLIYTHVVASGDPVSWTWSFSRQAEAVGGIAEYAGASSTVNIAASDVSPCGGETPVLLLSWTDFGTSESHEVTYNATVVGDENQLIRRHCKGFTGTPADEETVARNLAGTGSTDLFAECQPSACAPLKPTPVSVTLTITNQRIGTTQSRAVRQFRATTRVNR